MGKIAIINALLETITTFFEKTTNYDFFIHFVVSCGFWILVFNIRRLPVMFRQFLSSKYWDGEIHPDGEAVIWNDSGGDNDEGDEYRKTAAAETKKISKNWKNKKIYFLYFLISVTTTFLLLYWKYSFLKS